MIKVDKRLTEEKLEARLILQVHDELILDTAEEEAERVTALVRRCMEGVCPLSVPLVAQVRTGRSWYETK